MLQTLAHIAQIAGGLALLFAAGTYLTHRNQLNFDVIMNCNERFQGIMVDLENVNPKEGDKSKVLRAKKRYVDLCNEQIFYFRNGYLPREVIEEWLESMVDYLPLFEGATGEARTDCPGLVEPELMEGYPTLRKVFAVDGTHDPRSREHRNALARQIGMTVRPEPVHIILWRDLVDHFSRPRRGPRTKSPSATDEG